jgi:calcineurin-like phosphoesterase family protein
VLNLPAIREARFFAMTIYFTSDTHFGDARRIRVDKRPFKNIGEHDAMLIARWNAVVGPDDDVYHLGDFAVTMDAVAVESWLAALNGRKHLIVGNNDSPAVTASKAWASISHYAELMIDDRFLVLCHYPFRTWHRSAKGAIDIHGHSHGKLKELPRQYDVGSMSSITTRSRSPRFWRAAGAAQKR